MQPGKLKPNELLALVEREFHEHNKLWGEVATAYADSSLKLFDDTIRFVYQALTAMSLVAGFGFAGLQKVQTIPFFTGGEAIMFIALMYGLYKIKFIYTHESAAVEEKSQEIKKVYEKRSIALGEMMMALRRTGTLGDEKYVKIYEKTQKEILEVHGIGKPPVKNKDQSWFITFMIWIFIIGFILLLLSFIPIDYVSLISSNP